MKNSQVKFFLFVIWLICYLPFKHSYVLSEQSMAMLHLGDIQPLNDGTIDQRWYTCLAYLDEKDIHCSIQVKCQSNVFQESFYQWLTVLESSGHHVIHEEGCACQIHQPLLPSQNHRLGGIGFSQLMQDENSKEAVLKLTTPTYFFRNRFKYLSKKVNSFIIEGDPTVWTEQQFFNFQANIQYLLFEGIRFDIRGKEN